MKAPIHDLHVGNLLTYGSLAAAVAGGGRGGCARLRRRARRGRLAGAGRVAGHLRRPLRPLLREDVPAAPSRLRDRQPGRRLAVRHEPGGGPRGGLASGQRPAGARVVGKRVRLRARSSPRPGFYNVEADEERFVGLPAPATALVCSTYLVAPDPASPWIVPAWFTGCGLAMIALLAIPRPGATGLAA